MRSPTWCGSTPRPAPSSPGRGARVLPDDDDACRRRLLCSAASPRRSGESRTVRVATRPTKLATRRGSPTALTSLGPSYIKLGQFLATRDDIIGRELAADLSTLQDRLPPFSQERGARSGRGGARGAHRQAVRRVRPAGGRRLDRASAQGGGARARRCAQARRRQGAASRHRAALPARIWTAISSPRG